MRLSLLAGALIGIAFLHAWLWWCAPLGIAVLAHSIATAITYREAVVRSAAAGITKGLFATLWLMDAYPADWIGDVARSEQFIFIAFCWICSGATTGLGYTTIGVLIRRARSSTVAMRTVLFGCALTISEVVGSILFSLHTLSPMSVIDANFGFGMSGFLLAEHHLLQSLAIIGGVYALSFTMGILGYILFLLWPQKKLVALFAGVVCITSFLPGPHTWNSSVLLEPVAVVQTTFGSYRTMNYAELRSRQSVLMDGIDVALAQGARITVLPEDARLGVGTEPDRMASLLSEFTHSDGALIIDSYRTDISPDAVVLRAYIYDLDSQQTYTSEKRYMVPVGEFMPWLHSTLASLLGGADIFAHMRYVPGNSTLDATLPDSAPTLLFCFESGATPIVRERIAARLNPPLIVHPVSHSWFHEPLTLQNQERQMLIVQSIYTGIPILQAGNMAPSALYLPDGTIDSGTVIAEGSRWKTLLFTQH